MKLTHTFIFLCCLHWLPAQDTFSIVAVDTNTGEIGSAGASCLDNIQFPGSNGAIIISDIIPGRGAIHTQAFWNATNQNNARNRMLEGLSPAEIITWLKQNDVQGAFGQFSRQYGIVDFDPQGQPRSAAHTGSSTMDWKGHRLGATYAIQGNILLGPQILDSMEARFVATAGQPLAIRLMYALQGANVVGADTRCTANGTSSLSAFIRVALPSDTAGNFHLDLNVPSLPAGREPIDSLQTLFDNWSLVRAQSPDAATLRIAPNPSQGQLWIEWPGDPGTLSILDAQGQPHRTYPVNKGVHQWDTQLPGGWYLIRLQTEKGAVFTKKWCITTP